MCYWDCSFELYSNLQGSFPECPCPSSVQGCRAAHTRETEEWHKHWGTHFRGNIKPLCSWRCLRKNWVIFLSAGDVCWWQLWFQHKTSFQLSSVVIQPIEHTSLHMQPILKHSTFLFRTFKIHYKHLDIKRIFISHQDVSIYMKKHSKIWKYQCSICSRGTIPEKALYLWFAWIRRIFSSASILLKNPTKVLVTLPESYS